MKHFIDTVRQYPCLWNTDLRDYRHADKKDEAWKKVVDSNISEIEDVKTAKFVWKKLRDSHRNSLKRHMTAKSTQNTWKYAQNMEFLLPYIKMQDRPTTRTSSESNLSFSIQDSSNEQSNQQLAQLDNSDDDEQLLLNSSVPLENDKPVLGNRQPTQRTRKRNDDGDILECIREIERNHCRRQEEREKRRREIKHPTELFFASIAETTKKMPTSLQNRIKKKVLEIVCETEEEFEYGHHLNCPT